MRWTTSRSETEVAGLHLPVALALVALGVVHLAVVGVAAFAVLQAVLALVLGGFVVLIVGTSRMLVSGSGGVELPFGRLWWLPGALVTAGSLGMYTGFGEASGWLAASGAAWGLGLAMHVGLLASAFAAEAVSIEHGWTVRATALAAIAYGLASAVAVPAAMAGQLALFAALHLALAGFVVLAVAAVVLEVLPRFTGRRLPGAWAQALAIATVAGPAVLAVGFDGSRWALRAGALVEATGLVLLGAGLV
jgi:hypothetical protein